MRAINIKRYKICHIYLHCFLFVVQSFAKLNQICYSVNTDEKFVKVKYKIIKMYQEKKFTNRMHPTDNFWLNKSLVLKRMYTFAR